GGGLGVTGTMPDRTVSGNDRMLPDIGAADWANCGANVADHHLSSHRVHLRDPAAQLPLRRPPRADRSLALLFRQQRATLPCRKTVTKGVGMTSHDANAEDKDGSGIVIALHEARRQQ